MLQYLNLLDWWSLECFWWKISEKVILWEKKKQRYASHREGFVGTGEAQFSSTSQRPDKLESLLHS